MKVGVLAQEVVFSLFFLRCDKRDMRKVDAFLLCSRHKPVDRSAKGRGLGWFAMNPKL